MTWLGRAIAEALCAENLIETTDDSEIDPSDTRLDPGCGNSAAASKFRYCFATTQR